MNRAALQQRAAARRAGIDRPKPWPHERQTAEVRHPAHHVPFATADDCVVGPAYPCGTFGYGVEYWLGIARRSRNDGVARRPAATLDHLHRDLWWLGSRAGWAELMK